MLQLKLFEMTVQFVIETNSHAIPEPFKIWLLTTSSLKKHNSAAFQRLSPVHCRGPGVSTNDADDAVRSQVRDIGHGFAENINFIDCTEVWLDRA